MTTRHDRDPRDRRASPRGRGRPDRPVTTPRSTAPPRSRRHSATRDEDDDDQEDLDGEEDGDAGEEDGVAREARGEETGEEGAGEKGERERPARRSGRGACERETRGRCDVARGARARPPFRSGSTDEKNARDSTQIAFPFGDRPAWLDGSLPGDRGFDPFELGKKSEYLQFSPDALDGSAAKNPSGNVIGKVKATDNKPKARTLAVRARARACVFFVVPFASSRVSYTARAGADGRHHPSDIDRARDRVKIWFGGYARMHDLNDSNRIDTILREGLAR